MWRDCTHLLISQLDPGSLAPHLKHKDRDAQREQGHVPRTPACRRRPGLWDRPAGTRLCRQPPPAGHLGPVGWPPQQPQRQPRFPVQPLSVEDADNRNNAAEEKWQEWDNEPARGTLPGQAGSRKDLQVPGARLETALWRGH